MKVVVFGGSGFLGSHVADTLTAAGHQITVFDQLVSPYRGEGQQMVVGDMVMTKSFYIVVPYNLMEIFGAKGIQKKISFGAPNQDTKPLTDEEFQRCKQQLWQRNLLFSAGDE